jgi:hypothetical protein
VGQGFSPAVCFSAAARSLTALALLIVFAGTAALWAQPPSVFSKMADLSSPARLAPDWTLDGSGSWAMRDGLLVLEKAGVPSGPIRRPGALAILQSPPLADATLEVDVRSLAAETVKLRDVLLVAGWQSPTRFYYVHLSAVRDNVHNGIFLVDDADRRRIDTLSDKPPLTDQAWHRARLVHRANGRIEVYVDGGADPIMLATDATLPAGRMGVGSFDDAAEFRNVRVTGTVR